MEDNRIKKEEERDPRAIFILTELTKRTKYTSVRMQQSQEP